MREREYQMLKSQSEKFVDDTSMEGKSKEDLDKYYRRVATRRIKIGLMLAEYVKKHDIKIDQKDMQQAIFNEARNYPGQESLVIDYYVKNQKALETLSGPILEEKAVKAIFANEVSMSDKKYSVAEIEKFIEAESERDVL
jgi:trigger factor